MTKIQTVRGMRDFLSKDARELRYIEGCAKKVASLYGFDEVITPIVEHYNLMSKSGDEIESRMYAFHDLGGRKVVLRPEFTASIARLITTVFRNAPKPIRLFSVGTLYRYDEPQFGRYREFWQSNYEIIGSKRIESDVEVISLTYNLMDKLGLHNCWIKIGHVGILRGLLSDEDVEIDRQNHIMHLLDKKRWSEAIEKAKEFKVSKNGIEALKKVFSVKSNSIRILKQTKDDLKKFPASISAVENLQEVIDLCKKSGLKKQMSIETGFARGLEYYTGMIFEILSPEVDISLGGGGRYDKLVEFFGGESTPAVGVAHGLDRIALALEKQHTPIPRPSQKSVFVLPMKNENVYIGFKIASEIRKHGITVELEIMGRTLKRALHHANMKNVSHVIILGQEEIERGEAILRNMKTHEQETMKITKIPNKIIQT